MYNRITAKIASLLSLPVAIAVVCLACSLAIARPSGATLSSTSVALCVTDDYSKPTQPLYQIYLYDEYGNPVDVTDYCSYQQGHVFGALGEDYGVVNYQTGHVFDSLGNLVGYLVAVP